MSGIAQSSVIMFLLNLEDQITKITHWLIKEKASINASVHFPSEGYPKKNGMMQSVLAFV